MNIVDLTLTVTDEDSLGLGLEDHHTWHLQFPVMDEEMFREFVHEMMSNATDLMMAGEYDVHRTGMDECCSGDPKVCCSEGGPCSDSAQPESLHETDERR